MRMKKIIISLICILIGFMSCQNSYAPKPRGFFRIDFPVKEYQKLPSGYPYSFDFPKYSKLSKYKGQFENSKIAQDWLNVDFPDFSAHIHLTYKEVEKNLGRLIDDAHNFAYKHSLKADGIEQSQFIDLDSRVYGIVYKIRGNTASSVQFFCTDSTKHFLRGALYFDTEPNKDSLAPVIDFLTKDIEIIMESLEWEQTKI